MSSNAELARVALSLVEGTIDGAAGVDEVLVGAFADVDEAAVAHAYLAGFLLVALADARRESPHETCVFVRGLLD